MTDHQLTLLAAALSTSVPTLAVLIGMLVNNRQIDSLLREMEARFAAVDARFAAVDARFAAIYERFVSLEREFDTRFDAMQRELDTRFDAMHQALLRVEGVLDARLKHLEER